VPIGRSSDFEIVSNCGKELRKKALRPTAATGIGLPTLGPIEALSM
jgi:hypothetical protein